MIGHRFVDGTIVYDEIVTPLIHVILASSIVVSVEWLFAIWPRFMTRIGGNSFISHLDRISVYVYISHDMLYSGTIFSMFKWPLSFSVILPLYFVTMILLGTVLCYLGEKCTEKIDWGITWLLY